MDCEYITKPDLLVKLFRQNTNRARNEIIECFYTKFYSKFEGFARNRYNVQNDTDIFDAFTDGLLAFERKLIVNGFEEKGATIETYFIMFCKNKLREHLTKNGRHAAKNFYSEPSIIEKTIGVNDDNDIDVKELEQIFMEKEEILQEAFKQLGERCSEFVIWKKIDKLSKEEIASKKGIKPDTVRSEVHKCFKRLLKIVTDIRRQNNINE